MGPKGGCPEITTFGNIFDLRNQTPSMMFLQILNNFWKPSKQPDTLAKYLIDSLQSYKCGHGNALCPTQLDMSKTSMGKETY